MADVLHVARSRVQHPGAQVRIPRSRVRTPGLNVLSFFRGLGPLAAPQSLGLRHGTPGHRDLVPVLRARPCVPHRHEARSHRACGCVLHGNPCIFCPEQCSGAQPSDCTACGAPGELRLSFSGLCAPLEHSKSRNATTATGFWAFPVGQQPVQMAKGRVRELLGGLERVCVHLRTGRPPWAKQCTKQGIRQQNQKVQTGACTRSC